MDLSVKPKKNVLKTFARIRKIGQKEQEKKDQLRKRQDKCSLTLMWALNLGVALPLLPLKGRSVFILEQREAHLTRL